MRTPEQIEAMVPISDRSAQRFPRLRETQLELVRRFANAEARRFAPGEKIYEVGDRGVPAWFLLDGTADLFGRDGLDQEIALQELDTGHFTGELHQLGDRPTLAGARAGADGCVALPLDATRLRALIVGSAELGELIMRAFILRRVGLLERGVGPVLLGRAGSAELLRLQAFLTRNGYPHLVLNCASERGRQLLDDLALPPEDLPLLICACGRVLKRPSNEEASAWLGITPTLRDRYPLRRRRDRIRPRRPCDRRVRRLRGALGSGRRWRGAGRPGGRFRPHRELPWFPDRNLGPGPDRPRAQPGAEVRRRGGHSAGGDAARMRRWRPRGRRYGGADAVRPGVGAGACGGRGHQAHATSGRRSRTSSRSRATAFITGRRRSRPSSAPARRSPWSAPATRPARRWCSSRRTSSA